MPKIIAQLDWLSVLLYTLIIGIGWAMIYSASLETTNPEILNFSKPYGKQIIWIAFSILIIILVLSLDSKFLIRFSSVIYIASILLLAGLFVFGKSIAGQVAWYSFGSFSFQPAEFTKIAVSLATAKYLSEINVSLKKPLVQIKSFIILAIPMALILLQPDAGTALTFVAFIIPLYRKGLPHAYLILGISLITLFLLTLKFSANSVAISVAALSIIGLIVFRKRKVNLFKYFLVFGLAIGFVFSVNFVFNNVLLPHQQDRFQILLGNKTDIRGTGFNTYQSKVAIGSGGLTGKGWLKGTQTHGKFVPAQHTDYIFTTLAEEWGFVGSMTVLLIYLFFIIRLFLMAERQKQNFSLIYGYCVASILFIHFFINIGMVIGILPTIGIPLPLFSYGGSSLWGFTILIFIFLKMDAKRKQL
jgi:rod shape determining protein RodA